MFEALTRITADLERDELEAVNTRRGPQLGGGPAALRSVRAFP